MSKDDLMDATSSMLQAEIDKFSQKLQLDTQLGARKMLGNAQTRAAIAGAQVQAYRKVLSDINPALAEINSPDSPMALSIPTMMTLWKQRHGYKWVSEEEIVQDAYWGVMARRLHGLHMLERMEASLGSTWDRTSVFRLKDDENGY